MSMRSTLSSDDASEQLQVLPCQRNALSRATPSASPNALTRQLQAHAASLFEAKDYKFPFPLPVKGARVQRRS